MIGFIFFKEMSYIYFLRLKIFIKKIFLKNFLNNDNNKTKQTKQTKQIKQIKQIKQFNIFKNNIYNDCDSFCEVHNSDLTPSKPTQINKAKL